MTYKDFEELVLQAAGETKYDLFFWLFKKYPEYAAEYNRRVEEEAREAAKIVEAEKAAALDKEASWQRLCKKLRDRYGENVI